MYCHRLLHLIVQLRTDQNKIDLSSFNIESDLAGAGFFDLCPHPFEKFFFSLASQPWRRASSASETSLAAARHSLLDLWLSRITYINHSDKRQRTFVRRLNERTLELSTACFKSFRGSRKLFCVA
jgi:hypothetical protein